MFISGINIFHSLQNTNIWGCQKDFQRADLYVFAFLLSSPKQVFLWAGRPCDDRDQNIKKFTAIMFL